MERREACVPRKARGAFYEVPTVTVAPFGAPLPHDCEGKGNEGDPRADQIAGAMNHACINVEVSCSSFAV